MMNYNDNLSVIYCRMAKIFHIFVFFLFPFSPVQAHPESCIPETFPKLTIHSVYNRLETAAADLFSSGNHVAAYRPYTLSDLKTIAAAFIAGAAATALQAGSKVGMLKNIIIASLLLLLAWLYFYFRQYQRKQRSRIRNIIRSHYQKADGYTLIPEDVFSNISIEEISGKDAGLLERKQESLMTSETEAKLLEFLGAFEKGTLYNSKNMSLPFLAGALNTNTKYLSHVINRHKSSDFKSYINRLRINYIVDKLIHDEKYRQYKISILAEECGFSSHSKFASVFKTVTDCSPSAFIKQLESENDSFQENG